MELTPVEGDPFAGLGLILTPVDGDPFANPAAANMANLPYATPQPPADAGSRGAGGGSHNYVVFDDKTIAILKKYGLAGLGIGAGGAALMGQPQPAQAGGITLTPVQGDPFAQ